MQNVQIGAHTGAGASIKLPPQSSSSQVELVAGPFLHFRQVNAFLADVRHLPGVRVAELRRIHHGILSLLVEYVDDVPLDERLAVVTRFPTHAEARADRVVMVSVPRAA